MKRREHHVGHDQIGLQKNIVSMKENRKVKIIFKFGRRLKYGGYESR